MMLDKIEKTGERDADERLFLSLVDALIEREGKKEFALISNLSNISALLNEFLENINWVGFYLFDGECLILGPFQGLPACTRIELGKGVCGKSAESKSVINVPDVNTFPGHIACSEESKSEIVLPIIVNGALKGVLDIDSPVYSRFTFEDQKFLEKVILLIKEIF